MLAKVFSGAIVGLDAQIIEVEVDTSFGLPHFSIVGLPDKTVEESKERMAAAIKSTQFGNQKKEWLLRLNPRSLNIPIKDLAGF
jgi:magnesium chelatase family protein